MKTILFFFFIFYHQILLTSNIWSSHHSINEGPNENPIYCVNEDDDDPSVLL